MSFADFQKLDKQELDAKLDELNTEYANLRIQLKSGRLTQKHKVTETRRNIARLKTLLTAKQVKSDEQ